MFSFFWGDKASNLIQSLFSYINTILNIVKYFNKNCLISALCVNYEVNFKIEAFLFKLAFFNKFKIVRFQNLLLFALGKFKHWMMEFSLWRLNEVGFIFFFVVLQEIFNVIDIKHFTFKIDSFRNIPKSKCLFCFWIESRHLQLFLRS